MQYLGIIVVGNGARVVDAERVERIGKASAGFDGIERFVKDDIFCRNRANVLATDCAEERDVV